MWFMKLLMFDTEYSWFDTHCKTIDNVENVEIKDKIKKAAVIFIHVELEDENGNSKYS